MGNRFFRLIGLLVAVVIFSCGQDMPGEKVARLSQALTTNERVLGCESAADWTASTAGTTLATSSTHVEGAASLSVASPATGGTYLTSIPLSSLGSDVGDSVTVDIRYPNPAPNPFWFGELGVVLVSPSLQLWWENLGTQNLQGATPGQFARFSFPIGSAVRDKLRGNYSDLQLKVFLNVPSAPAPWLVDRISFGAGGGGTAGSAGSGGSGGASGSGNAAILGFEAADLWSTTGGTLVAHSTRIEGNFSLELSNVNQSFTELTSDPLSTVGPVASVIGFDLSVPNPEGDIWWWGSAAITIDCPSKGLNNRWIGQQELDGSALDRFRRVEVVLPDEVRTALQQGPYQDLRIKIALTVPPTSGPYLLDRFTFAPQMPEPAPPAPSADVDRALSFETLEPWKASAATISLSSIASVGTSAIAVSNFGYTELTSQRLSSLGTGLRNEVRFDIRIPEPPDGAGWTGSVGLIIDLPSQGLNSLFVGQVDLSNTPPDTWTHKSLPLPPDVLSKLTLSYSDARLKLLLNRPVQVGAWIIDNIDFGQLRIADPRPQVSELYVIPLPKGTTFADVALGHSLVRLPGFVFGGERVQIESGAKVRDAGGGFADVVAPRGMASGQDPDIVILSGSEVDGASAFNEIVNSGAIHGTARAGASIANTGSIGVALSPVDLASFEAGRLPINLPSGSNAPDFFMETGEPARIIEPGTYDFVQTRAWMTMRTGTYYLNSFVALQGANVELDNEDGPIVVFIRGQLNVRGANVFLVDDSKRNVLFVRVGDTVLAQDGNLRTFTIEPAHRFEASIVAARDGMNLRAPAGGYIAGSFFGRRISVQGELRHRPFQREDCGPSSCGVFGCDTADEDGDGLFDCEEQSDGDPFTDPQVFNGVRAKRHPSCGGAPSCSAIDTLSEADACVLQHTANGDHNVYAGWDLGAEALKFQGCANEVDFWPPWPSCVTGSQIVDYTGFVKLAETGKHCFQLLATSPGVCGAMFFNGTAQGHTSADGVDCFDIAAGVYPIRWLVAADPSAGGNDHFKFAYCFGGASDCAPQNAIPQRMLRPEFTPCSPDECTELCPCGPGGSCTSSSECNSGLACVDGSCTCVGECEGKTCGDDPGNGCGGHCTNYCADRQAGCTADYQCPIGSVCLPAAGPVVGLAVGVNICLPAECADPEPDFSLCGTVDDICGLCPVCREDDPCADTACGPDPFGCGVDCGGCAQGSCVAGLCAFNTSSTVKIPDPANEDVPIVLDPLPPEPTPTVGAMPGAFSVSDRGTATYDIPIDVPPGRAGMQPALGFRYTSTSENGQLGVGWSLGGLSMITRCPRTNAIDGWPAPVRMDDDDALCIDGKRMHFDEFDAEAGGDWYGTEPTDFSRILGVRSAEHGYDYFKVWTKGGRILHYGTDENSRVAKVGAGTVRSWHLSRVEDRAGNYMEIKYHNHGAYLFPNVDAPDIAQPVLPNICTLAVETNGNVPPECENPEINLASIHYGGFSGSGVNVAHTRTVEFKYTGRSDHLDGYRPGEVDLREPVCSKALPRTSANNPCVRITSDTRRLRTD